MTTNALYRVYNAAGELIYVGMTNNPFNRIRDHEWTKSWASEISVIKVEHFADRSQLSNAERSVIADERPRYNVLHTVFDESDAEDAGGDGLTEPEREQLIAVQASWFA